MKNFYFIDKEQWGNTEIFFTDYDETNLQQIKNIIKKFDLVVYDDRINKLYFKEWRDKGFNYYIYSSEEIDIELKKIFEYYFKYEYLHADDIGKPPC